MLRNVSQSCACSFTDQERIVRLRLRYMDPFQKLNACQAAGAIIVRALLKLKCCFALLCRRLEQNPLRNLFGHGPELMTVEHLASEVRRE